MIKSVGGLALPASAKSKSEIFTQTTSKRTVSGRLVTKYAYSKWRCTFELPDAVAMDIDYQAALYGICMGAKLSSTTVTFINPYNNNEETIRAKCTEMNTPDIMALANRKPSVYTGVKVVLEEE